MTPEGLKAVRDRLAALPCQGWYVEYDHEERSYGVTRVESPQWRDAVVFDDGPNMREVAEFLAHSRADIPALLAHADALQARLDAAEAERDQLRAIFSQDYLEENEAARLAYERGRADARREYSTEIDQAFDHLTGKEVSVGPVEWTFNHTTLEALPLLATVAVSPELLADSTSGVPGGLADDDDYPPDDGGGAIPDCWPADLSLAAGSKPGEAALSSITSDAMDIGKVIDELRGRLP